MEIGYFGSAVNDFFPSSNDLTYILSPAGLLVGLMGLLGESGSARLLLLLINLPDGQGRREP